MTPSPIDEPDARLREALSEQYEIIRLLGVGGMGAVWLGRDRTLERDVAIKVVADELAANPLYRERFLREARTVANLRHDGIVSVYAAGETQGLLYFVMEYVRGESLRDRLSRERRLSPDEAIPIVADVSRALHAAHAKGVVHRDVKPENILLHEETGRAMVTDFGVAQAVAQSDDGRMTATGMVVGSPRYMSPEQAVGDRDLDGRSDQYSLGLVAYEMLSGSEPFEATSAGALLAKRLTSDPAPLAAVSPHVSAAVSEVIMKSLARERGDRWAHSNAYAAALLAAAAGEDPYAAASAATDASSHVPTVAAKRSGRRAPATASRSLLSGWRGLALLAAAVLLLVAGAGIWKSTRSSGPRRATMVVLPFELVGVGDDMEWLSEGAVSMLTLDLANWEDLGVVDYARTLDIIRNENLESVRIGPSEANRVARATSATSFVLGRIQRIGDSLTVIAGLYDAQANTPHTSFTESASVSDDPRLLFDRVARDILKLSGAPELTPSLASSTTASLTAYRDYLTGLKALNAWQLDSADRTFARAIERDSGFALAYYKRALVHGWSDVAGDMGTEYARLAVEHAARLTPRDRALVEAYLALSEGISASMRGQIQVAETQLNSARQRYQDIIARDSLDAEAWYGLGDAYFHTPVPNDRIHEVFGPALSAFDRTLALDSTFHLAYQHKLNIYQLASLPQRRVMLDGDSLVAAPANPSDSGRVALARQAAGELAIREARHWAESDPDAPASHRALAEAYATSRDYASAAGTLRRALSNPRARELETQYALAVYLLNAGETREARETLEAALREQPLDSLIGRASARTAQVISAASGIALQAGKVRDAIAIADLAGKAHPTPSVLLEAGVTSSLLYRTFAELGGASVGIPWSEARPVVDSALAGFSRLPELEAFFELKNVVPIYATLVSRDTTYLDKYPAIRQVVAASPVLRAWMALAAGDTATAVEAARLFTRGKPGLNRNMQNLAIEAEILLSLGDLRGALETFAAMEPSRYGALNFEAGWGLHTQSKARRAEIHAALGERDQAISLYEEFIRDWAEADPELQPQVQAARRRLAELSDAAAPRPVGAS